jgi:hypothetical protein
MQNIQQPHRITSDTICLTGRCACGAQTDALSAAVWAPQLNFTLDLQVAATAQRRNSAIIELMSTLEEIEAAVQQLPLAKRAEFRAWFQSFDETDWDQQMEDDITTGTLDWLADEANGDSYAGRCTE